MIRLFESLREWQDFRASARGDWGFVPTMGALHAGHLSLVAQAQKENDHILVSIFVNPTQFNNAEDLEKYPRTLARDLQLLEPHGELCVLHPRYEELFADRYQFEVQEKEKSLVLCGAHRPGHFTGVLTVVMKLLNIAHARRAYFGEKDYQQLTLIREMAQAFFLPTEIVGCPIVREASGLAMSSRNERLSETERTEAAFLFRALQRRAPLEEIRKEIEAQGFKLDYLEERWGRRLVAAFKGSVRLIDNVAWPEN